MDLRLDKYLLRYNRFINFIGVGLCRTSVVWRPLWWVVLPPFLGYQIDLPFQSSLFCTERNKRAKKFYFRRKLIFARYFFLYRLLPTIRTPMRPQGPWVFCFWGHDCRLRLWLLAAWGLKHLGLKVVFAFRVVQHVFRFCIEGLKTTASAYWSARFAKSQQSVQKEITCKNQFSSKIELFLKRKLGCSNDD